MRNNTILDRLACTSLILALVVAPATAQTILGFDPPANVIEIPPSATPPGDYAVTCYLYDDVMIQVSDSKSPAPEDALILPQPENGARAKCGRSKPNSVKLSSAGFYFNGRLGDFLLFEAADPGGASQFIVFNVRNGHQLFQDGVLGADGYLGLYGITSVKMTGGVLHMRYRRGVNAPCSLLSDRDRCWAQLLSKGDIPRGAFSEPPTAEVCKKGYEGNPIGLMPPPDDDPSIVSYDVALTLDSNGNAEAQPLSTPQCDPMP